MPLNLIFIQPGNYGITDNGIFGDNVSSIIDGNGVTLFTLAHPADSLGLTASSADVNLFLDFAESLGGANVAIGSLTTPGQQLKGLAFDDLFTFGTVSIGVSAGISERNPDVDTDVSAAALLLSAVNGIGVADAIETRTSLLEAETTTGGINLVNFGSVQIGAGSADIDGLDVVTSGNINLLNYGSIFLTEANSVTASEMIHGGSVNGNITLTAVGVNADIFGNVDNGVASAPNGQVVLTADRDIQLGTVGTSFNNDIIASDAVKLTAGRDIILDGFADILSDNFGLDTGENLIFTAGRDIRIRNIAGTSASATASGSGGADARITTGFGGMLEVSGPGSFALGSTSGNVIVLADRVQVDAGSGISAPGGGVFLQSRTAGWEFDLGSATDAAFKVELSNTELNRLFAPKLTIGGVDAGRIIVSSSIAMTASDNATDTTLQSGSLIRLNAGVTLQTLGDLTLRAASDIQLLSGSALVAPGTVTCFVDEDGAADGGLGGKALVDFSMTSALKIIGNVDADLLQGGANNDTLDGGGGIDTLVGRDGDDTYIYTAGDTITELGGEGVDTIVSDASFNLGANLENAILTGAANRFVNGNGADNLIVGNAGDNALAGFNGKDTLNGGSGKDTLDGGAGKDRLNGGGDNDVLNGGDKADKLTGGLGADTFRFDSALSASNVDAIADYDVPADTIELENAIFTSLTAGVLLAGRFAPGTTAVDENDFIIYDSTTGAIFYDADGSGAIGQVQFASVAPGTALTRLDFLVT